MNEVLTMFFKEQIMSDIDHSYHDTKSNRYHSYHLSFLNRVSLILFFLIFFSKFFPIFPQIFSDVEVFHFIPLLYYSE